MVGASHVHSGMALRRISHVYEQQLSVRHYHNVGRMKVTVHERVRHGYGLHKVAQGGDCIGRIYANAIQAVHPVAIYPAHIG